MIRTCKCFTIATLAVSMNSGVLLAQERKPSVGYRVGEFMRQVDEGVQQRLDRQPEVRQRITNGIDRFADNLIDAVTPESDANTRQVQRNAVQVILNPSRTESNQAFSNMQRAVVESARSPHVTNSPAASFRPFQTTDSNPGNSSRCPSSAGTPGKSVSQPVPHMLQSNWHGMVWREADRGLLATAGAVQGGLPRLHAATTRVLTGLGLATDTASVLATLLMVVASLLLLIFTLSLPRRPLKRRIRLLERQLASLQVNRE